MLNACWSCLTRVMLITQVQSRFKRFFCVCVCVCVQAVRGTDITVKSYKVESKITSRFAHTTVRSSVVNSGLSAQSIGFNVQIPKRAFITNFTMNVNGITFVGSVREKTVARNLYAQARARGKAAGIVRTNSQEMETFKTEVHVPPGSKVEFELHYQELMQRKLGVYTHTLHIQPGRLVPVLQVDVYVFEPKGIKFVETPNTLGDHFSGVTKITHTKDKAHVVFKPTVQQQRKCPNCTESAVDGVFTVRYDVERESNAGELQVSDGHFVQFFAPSDLTPLSKNIVFVIDVSGSMWGLKMKQTVEAMMTILDDLTMDDYFSIIDFNHNVRCWSEDLVAGTSIQVAEAKKYIQNIKPNGGTNINEAILKAVQILMKAHNQGMLDPRSVSMIILVSDGDPTVGEEPPPHVIQKNVKKVMREEFSLFSLGIGFDVDFDFLERIAMENRGVAQRIYANHDASEQLKQFYSQVSSPLLRKITIQFPEDAVSDITQNRFDKFFKGSEIVVAGKMKDMGTNMLQSFTTASAEKTIILRCVQTFNWYCILNISWLFVFICFNLCIALFIRVKVEIEKEHKVTVTIDARISMTVLLHRVWKKHPFNVDYLGFYSPDYNQFSTQVHGLIGQFVNEPEVKVFDVRDGTEPEKKQATMEVKGNKLTVTRGWQKDYRFDKKHGSDVYCWFVHNSGKGFIDGHYSSYIVPNLDSFLPPV
uniref:Inter-alpha-trypsin inhibitor heavy chain 2 n=1 Tax=Astyanax mexicanus TaxID=7994 RepID=A0A8B9HHY5_ASTMX